MAKQFVLYNLKDGLKEEDFLKFVNEYKGPFISGLSAVKRYTITTVKMALKAEGGPPAPVDTPFKLAAVLDLTSLADMGKVTTSEAYQKEFLPRFAEWVTDFLILQAEEVYDNSDQ